MYICININSRVTELYHTLRSVKDNKRLLRVKIQNEKKDTQVSLVKKSDLRISSQSKIVSHHSLTLETEKQNKKHPGNTSHTLWNSHTLQRAAALLIKLFFTKKQSILVGVDSTRGLEKWEI